MSKLKILSAVIGAVQIILGAAFLLFPSATLAWMGLSQPGADIHYMLAMLAARFLVYGAGMFVIMRAPERHRVWLDGMIAIQALDLCAGVFYTSVGIVPLAVSAFPMINASIFVGLLLAWRPKPVLGAAMA